MNRIDRREFLSRGASLAGGIAGARLLAACGSEAPTKSASAAEIRGFRTAVDFARDHDLRLALRSGGHSFAGYSTGDGLVLDLNRLTAVEV